MVREDESPQDSADSHRSTKLGWRRILNVLGWLPDGSEKIRKSAINLTVLLGLGGVAATIAIEMSHEQIVIQPLSVPASLNEAGITGEIVARWIRDEIQNVQTTASTSRPRNLFVSDEELSDIAIGESGFTLRSVMDVMRRLFGIPAKQIGGEIVVRSGPPIGTGVGIECHNVAQGAQTSRFQIRLRTSFSDEVYWPACGNDIEQLAQAAAHRVMRQSNPFVLASYFLEVARRQNDPSSRDRARKLAEFIIRDRSIEERPWAMNLLGLLEKDEKNHIAEIEIYRDIEQQGFRFHHALNNWGLALTRLDPPQYENAIEKYRAAIEIHPEDAPAHLLWGIALIEKEAPQYAVAIEKFHDAIKIDPDYADAYTHLGIALVRTDPPQYEAAIEKFRTATRIDPNYAEAYAQWGLALASSDPPQYEAAIEKFRTATRINPGFAFAYASWGTALTELHPPRYPAAIEKFRKATDIDPEYADAYHNWGIILRELGQTEKARAALRHAACLKPGKPLDECPVPNLD